MRLQLIISFILLHVCASAQVFSTWGTEFFIPNVDGVAIIETNQTASVTVEDLINGTTQTLSYPANTVNYVNMRSFTSNFGNVDAYFNLAVQRTIVFTSDVPINIRYSFDYHTGGGSSIALPTEVLGSNYTISTYEIEDFETADFSSLTPILMITGTEDNSVIEINLTHPSENGFPVNVPFTITLNRGEVLPIRAPFCFLNDTLGGGVIGCYSNSGELITSDFSGSTIKSIAPRCTPVAVHLYFGGYLSGPYAGGCCSDAMLEQYFPDKFWGSEFYMVPEQHTQHGNLLRVFARFDQTDVFLNENLVTTLNQYESFDTLLIDPVHVKTSKQSFASHFLLSNKSNPALNNVTQITDPETIFLLPISYQSKNGIIDYSTVINEGVLREQWMSIVTHKDNVGSIILDGTPVASNEFQSFNPSDDYRWAYIFLDEVTHVISATQGSFQSLVFANGEAASRVNYVGIDTTLNSPNSSEVLCYEGEPLILTAPDTLGTLSWSTGQTGNSITVSDTGIYVVQGVDECGVVYFIQSFYVSAECDSVPPVDPTNPIDPVIVDTDFFIPNVFTPNGDGKNDQFSIEIPASVKRFSFRIVNRWGNQLFATSEMNLFWDGRSHGSPASEGTYFWILEGEFANGEKFVKHGQLSLIR